MLVIVESSLLAEGSHTVCGGLLPGTLRSLQTTDMAGCTFVAMKLGHTKCPLEVQLN